MKASKMTNEELAQELVEPIPDGSRLHRSDVLREAAARLRKQGEFERANENMKIILSNAIKTTTPKCLDCTKVCDTCDNVNCQWVPLAKMLIAGVDYDPSDYDFGLFAVSRNESIAAIRGEGGVGK